MTLRVAFAGTPEFSRTILETLYQAGFEIPLVLTQPDRPAKRGLQLLASPVKQFALAHNLPLLQTPSLRIDGRYGPEAQAAIAQIQASACDVMVVVAYGLILPQRVLDLPRYGCFNIHASLLPRWRGAAPIQRAIEAGDPQTGISLMQMDEGLDTGPVLSMQPLALSDTDTCGQVHDRLALLGAKMIVDMLHNVAKHGQPTATAQEQLGVCYAEKIRKEEALLNFNDAATILARRIRAFNPAPGMSTSLRGHIIKVWQAHACTALSSSTKTAVLPGTIMHIDETGIIVACGQGHLCLTELQKGGSKRLPLKEFLKGFPLSIGEQLEFSKQ